MKITDFLSNRKIRQEIMEWALVFATALSMFAYGIGKYWQFGIGREMDIQKTVSELSGMELMWAFYGYSDAYPIILGLLEILGAFLLLIPRTRLIGVLLLSTILVNIIIQDIIYGVLWGALFSACVYQGMLLLICWFRREQVKTAFAALTQKSPAQQHRPFIFHLLLFFLAFILAIILKYLEIFGPRWFS